MSKIKKRKQKTWTAKNNLGAFSDFDEGLSPITRGPISFDGLVRENKDLFFMLCDHAVAAAGGVPVNNIQKSLSNTIFASVGMNPSLGALMGEIQSAYENADESFIKLMQGYMDGSIDVEVA